MPIADNLKYWQDLRDLTTAELAEKANVPEATITKIRTRVTKNPNADTLQRLAKALECSINDLTDTPSVESSEIRELLPKKLSTDPEELVSVICTTLKNQRLASDRTVAELRKDRNTWRKFALFALAVLVPVSIATLVLTAVTYWDLCHLDRGFIRETTLAAMTYSKII